MLTEQEREEEKEKEEEEEAPQDSGEQFERDVEELYGIRGWPLQRVSVLVT